MLYIGSWCQCEFLFFFRAYVYISFVLLLLWLPKFVSSWSNFLNLACVSVCMFHCVRLCVSVCNYATRNVFLLKINDNYKSFDFMTNGRRFNIKTSFFSNIKINLYFIKMDLCIFILDVNEWHFILLIAYILWQNKLLSNTSY